MVKRHSSGRSGEAILVLEPGGMAGETRSLGNKPAWSEGRRILITLLNQIDNKELNRA